MLELVLSKPYKLYKLYPRRTVQNQMALNKIKPSNRHHKEQESNYSLELRQKKLKPWHYWWLKAMWKQHTDQLCKKLCPGVCVIKRILKAKYLQTAKTSYYAMIESELRNGMGRNLHHQPGEKTCFQVPGRG